MEQREFIVEAEAAGQRIDRFLSGEDTGVEEFSLDTIVFSMTKSVPPFSKPIRTTPPLSECLTALLIIFERTNFKIAKFMKILVIGR